MTDTSTSLTDLGLTAKDVVRDDSVGCGGGCNCTCGANDSAEQESIADTAISPEGPVSANYAVLGMTCAHCVSSVREELSEISGVLDVTVVLNVGGASSVTVTSAAALDSAAVTAAVTEAGYELASTAS
ncbi:copper chaperone CopZ [Glaciihabitans tibetensis]|uniref:Copper chaperone CopZ n=1 Tax=Glaciihabitans tibetensis TaxID=1266600 RepID=A0A2T0VGU5_9MICO|nr:heavy metal-associated domain-containing protein [Glaciihabitans tibetensis]PRY69391.1 copper chaperone CopZ [Glaciihabitans tibetensis]